MKGKAEAEVTLHSWKADEWEQQTPTYGKIFPWGSHPGEHTQPDRRAQKTKIHYVFCFLYFISYEARNPSKL